MKSVNVDEVRLTELRREIELLDVKIVNAVAKRVKLARRIQDVKRRLSLPAVDLDRELTLQDWVVLAARSDSPTLDEESVRELHSLLLDLTKDQLEIDR